MSSEQDLKSKRSSKCFLMGIIQGKILDKLGNSIEGVSVLITGNSPEHRDIAALTNEDGEFCFDELLGGRYILIATTEEGIQSKIQVDVEPGQTSYLDFIIDLMQAW